MYSSFADEDWAETPLIYFFEGYPSSLQISRKRAGAQRQLLNVFANLPDEQTGNRYLRSSAEPEQDFLVPSIDVNVTA